MKKIGLIAICAVFVISLAACTAAQPQQSVAQVWSAAPSESESGLPKAFQSPTASPSAASVMAASAKTLEKLTDVDSINAVFAADKKLAAAGETMTVTANGNTRTYILSFDRGIALSDLPADFQSTMEQSLQAAIDEMVKKYPDLPASTFIYNVVNGVSGEILLTATKNYTAK